MSERLRPIAAAKVIDEARAELEGFGQKANTHTHRAQARQRAPRSRSSSAPDSYENSIETRSA